MNVGFIFIILFAIIAGIFGMIFVASHTPTGVSPDSYGRMPDNDTNMTKQNVTDTMPTGMNIMGYAAIIVALLVVVAVVVAMVAKGSGGYSRRM